MSIFDGPYEDPGPLLNGEDPFESEDINEHCGRTRGRTDEERRDSMLTCENCKDWVACGSQPGEAACDEFDGDRCPVKEEESDVDKRIETLEETVTGLAFLVGRLERRWDKVMAAIVREANE